MTSATRIAANSRMRTLRSGIAALIVTLVAGVLAATAPATDLSGLELPSVSAAAAETVEIDEVVSQLVASEGQAEVIVRTTPAARSGAAETVTATGGQLGFDLPLIDSFSATVTADGLEALAGLPGVEAVMHDGQIKLAHDDTRVGDAYGDSYFPDTIGATSLRGKGNNGNGNGNGNKGIDGSGVGIAVIDSGVSEVTDLEGRVVGAWDISGEDNNVDTFGHGTFIAGIAAGDGSASAGQHDGVAPGAHVVPVKVAGEDGSADLSKAIVAMQYVVAHKDAFDIGVMNLSLGVDSVQPNKKSPLNYAVQQVWDAGIVVVVSAGNEGARGAGAIPKPADDPLVITAGATDFNGTADPSDDTVAEYSSHGPSIPDQVKKPDLVAPGSHLIAAKSPGSTVDGAFPGVGDDYMQGSGSSYAAAVTAGAVALLRAAHPDWTPDQVKGALLSTARPGPVGDHNVDGHGVLDVAAAAALSDPAPANQGVERSNGSGSLEKDLERRGGFVFEWDGTNWYGTNWYGTNWYGTNWYGTNWYGTNWYGTNWYDMDWSGTNWYGTNWYGTNWYGTNWYGTNWYGTNWYGTNWY